MVVDCTNTLHGSGVVSMVTPLATPDSPSFGITLAIVSYMAILPEMAKSKVIVFTQRI